MNCYYCDQITAHDADYPASPAEHDLASEAPRCPRHWRYLCGQCGRPAHFMACGFDPQTKQFFCAACAQQREEVPDAFWHWNYYWRYRSPWSGQWCIALDRLEYDGLHPMQRPESLAALRRYISSEPHLMRYPRPREQWRLDHQPDDEELRQSWNANAQRWADRYDQDGDSNRKYQSDEPMLRSLGPVRGLNILDVGSGEGYLSRKLAAQGARVIGVELCDRFIDMARQRAAAAKLDIPYHHASVADMSFLPDASFDKAVSNYVLMDVRDYEPTIREVFRLLKAGGLFIAVISHPCFSSAEGRWHAPAPDSPRTEDRSGVLADRYFQRGPMSAVWDKFDPVLGFHRPLRDYWRAFAATGFSITDFEEPSITDLGRRELRLSQVQHRLRIPYSCLFQLRKPG